MLVVLASYSQERIGYIIHGCVDLLTGSIWFASEMKALIDDCERFISFPPGHIYSSKQGINNVISSVLFSVYVDSYNSFPPFSSFCCLGFTFKYFCISVTFPICCICRRIEKVVQSIMVLGAYSIHTLWSNDSAWDLREGMLLVLSAYFFHHVEMILPSVESSVLVHLTWQMVILLS